MEWNVMWVPWVGAGLEHLRLRQNDTSMLIDSVVIGVEDEQIFRLWYEIQTDSDWKVRACTLRLLGDTTPEITLHADGEGHWADAAGVPLTALEGCIDVDISVTPFTNTLPIRRVPLHAGQSVDSQGLVIDYPGLWKRAGEVNL